MTVANQTPVTLDGGSLTLDDLVRVARDPGTTVACDPTALERVRSCRARIEKIVDQYKADYARYAKSRDPADRPTLTYGVTTGFGAFKHIPIPPDELEALQTNILLSHAVGVGESADPDDPANYFPADVVRAILVLRLNAFLKGFSGVRVELVACIEAMINRGIVPLVPTRGSVGSSGDLCPLAHLFGPLVDVGRFYIVDAATDLSRWARGAVRPPGEFAEALGRPPARPTYKEGLALTNGTSVSTALLALAVHDASRLARTADVAASMSLEAICGRSRAFDPKVHSARGQAGQIDSAASIRAMVTGSRLIDRSADVQDAYSVRCAPQVHGASRDAIAYARMVVDRELNAATDNPLFFQDDEGWTGQFAGNRPAGGSNDEAYSAGNFHGQPIGIAADVLAIAVAELANIAERRTQMLLDPNHNRNLPANLVPNRGVNSGYMLCQYASAALVSENKVLAHPASVDSIPTAANIEDHVAMATMAARKVRTILANAHAVLTNELLVAAQALEWRIAMNLGPNAADRSPPAAATEAFGLEADGAAIFEDAVRDDRRAAIAAKMGRGTAAAYLVIRALAPPLVSDRRLDEDITRVRQATESGAILTAVESVDENPLRDITPAGLAARI